MSGPTGAEVDKFRKATEDIADKNNRSSAEMFKLTKNYFRWSLALFFITALATSAQALIMWLRK